MSNQARFRILLAASATDDDEFAAGRVQAPEFSESFRVPLTYWRVADYLAGWRTELNRLKQGARTAVLLTVAMPPDDANFLRGYVLYRRGEKVYMQETLLFADQAPGGLDLDNPAATAPDRETETEDGLPISEWEFAVDDIDLEKSVGRFG